MRAHALALCRFPEHPTARLNEIRDLRRLDRVRGHPQGPRRRPLPQGTLAGHPVFEGFEVLDLK